METNTRLTARAHSAPDGFVFSVVACDVCGYLHFELVAGLCVLCREVGWRRVLSSGASR